MSLITHERLMTILDKQASPCISLYMPTHRRHPENQQDPIRFRNLLDQMESSLRQKYPQERVKELIGRLQLLAGDRDFWNHRTVGLAVLGSSDVFEVFDLQRPTEELLVVADSFHVKPLLRSLQATDRYQVLGLNRHEIKLYEGNQDELDEVQLADGVPATIEEALGSELTEPHLTVASYAGSGRGERGAPSMHHGHGQKKDEVDIDDERFFRAIDRAIWEHHSRPSGLPLILAALPEHHDLFHKVSQNPFLIDRGIQLAPQSLSMDRLRSEAWQVMEPGYLERVGKLIDDFKLADSRQLGATELDDVLQALRAGRVETLLVDAERQIPGKLNAESDGIELQDLAGPEVDDVLDDLAELAMAMGGKVMVIPPDQMPSTTGVAAICRF